MKDEFLVDGIKLALEKGETMKYAMMSFFRAGYGKEEIEEAARKVLQEKQIQKQQAVVPQKNSPIKSIIPSKSIIPKPKQISSYDASSSKISAILIVKIALILIALGALAFVIIFREELMSFVNGLL